MEKKMEKETGLYSSLYGFRFPDIRSTLLAFPTLTEDNSISGRGSRRLSAWSCTSLRTPCLQRPSGIDVERPDFVCVLRFWVVGLYWVGP